MSEYHVVAASADYAPNATHKHSPHFEPQKLYKKENLLWFVHYP